MPPRRRIPLADGVAAVRAWQADPHGVDRTTLGTAVRYALEELSIQAPGRSVEVRVPPFGAVQCVAGLTHTRGTPPNVTETDAATWLALVVGDLDWQHAWEAGLLRVSGTRADLSAHLPLVGRRGTAG